MVIFSVRRMIDRGSAPARLRAHLKARTRAARSLAEQLSAQQDQAARLVQPTLPGSVMGGDLLRLFSDPLRALLPGEDSAQAAPEKISRRGRLNVPVGRRDGRGTLPEQPPGAPQQKRTVETKQSPFSVRSGHSPFSTVNQPLPLGGRLQTAPYPAGSGRTISRDSDEVMYSSKPGGGEPGSATLRLPHHSGALERALATYFRPGPTYRSSEEPRDVRGRLARPNYSSLKPEQAVLPGLSTGAQAGLSNSSAWPAITGQQVVEKLQAFVSGDPLAERGSPVIPTGESGRVEVNNTFHLHVGGPGQGTSSPFQELSDQVAEILRRQAIQHGIDVT